MMTTNLRIRVFMVMMLAVTIYADFCANGVNESATITSGASTFDCSTHLAHFDNAETEIIGKGGCANLTYSEKYNYESWFASCCNDGVTMCPSNVPSFCTNGMKADAEDQRCTAVSLGLNAAAVLDKGGCDSLEPDDTMYFRSLGNTCCNDEEMFCTNVPLDESWNFCTNGYIQDKKLTYEDNGETQLLECKDFKLYMQYVGATNECDSLSGDGLEQFLFWSSCCIDDATKCSLSKFCTNGYKDVSVPSHINSTEVYKCLDIKFNMDKVANNATCSTTENGGKLVTSSDGNYFSANHYGDVCCIDQKTFCDADADGGSGDGDGDGTVSTASTNKQSLVAGVTITALLSFFMNFIQL